MCLSGHIKERLAYPDAFGGVKAVDKAPLHCQGTHWGLTLLLGHTKGFDHQLHNNPNKIQLYTRLPSLVIRRQVSCIRRTNGECFCQPNFAMTMGPGSTVSRVMKNAFIKRSAYALIVFDRLCATPSHEQNCHEHTEGMPSAILKMEVKGY
jgi:hypothetical protein